MSPQPMPGLRAQYKLLEASIERLLLSVQALPDGQVMAPSRLPGWSRGHVLAHLAGATDARTGLLTAARAGTVGQQYPSEDSRARGIEAGARRPPGEIRAGVRAALGRFRAAVACHPADDWDALGEWLGGHRQPVHRVLPGLRREIEYHHVDLDIGYRSADWPEDFTREQLAAVAGSMSRREDGPPVTLVAPHALLRIGDGALATVTGPATELLAWMTGRGDGRELQVTPAGPLPQPPPLA